MQELNELKLNYSQNNDSFPILAIDFGERRVGIAISDRKGIVAAPLTVLQITRNKSYKDIVEEILELIEENRVNSILLGMPQSFVESHNKTQQKIISFKELIEEKSSLPIYLYDESFSTSNAQNMLLSLGQNSKASRSKIDMVSAALFLQEYLDSIKTKDELQSTGTTKEN